MKIRFRTDPVELFRRGIDTTTSIVSFEVEPSTLTEEQRELISKHLLATDDGCDVVYDPERAKASWEVVPIGGRPGGDLVEAKKPTLESLLEAI